MGSCLLGNTTSISVHEGMSLWFQCPQCEKSCKINRHSVSIDDTKHFNNTLEILNLALRRMFYNRCFVLGARQIFVGCLETWLQIVPLKSVYPKSLSLCLKRALKPPNADPTMCNSARHTNMGRNSDALWVIWNKAYLYSKRSASFCLPNHESVRSRGAVEIKASYWIFCPFLKVATLLSLSILVNS